MAAAGSSRKAGPAGLAARRIAVDIVDDALGRRQTLDAALDPEHGHPGLVALSGRDRGFVKVLATETIRRRGEIRAAIDRYLDKPLPKSAGHTPTILAVGACQILFLDVAPHAAVDTAVQLASGDRGARHFRALVNAVLRRIASNREELRACPDGVVRNTPDWLSERWIATYGEMTATAIMAAHLAEAPLDLTVKSDPGAWADRLGGAMLPTGSVRLAKSGDIAAIDGFGEGEWWVQDAAAALPVKLLGDVRGLKVADLCAAPGGKTAQLCAAGATVTAVDRSARRMGRLRSNLARLRLAAETVVADATAWRPGTAFDAVLLDAPCSATGTLRRHPDIAWIRRETEIDRLADLQRRLLDNAAAMVRPGGMLIYVTCSLEPEECEAQVETLIAAGAPVRRAPVLASEIGGLSQCVSERGDLRTLPCHQPAAGAEAGGMDGFYAARLIRAG